MVIDRSALIAILFREVDAKRYKGAIDSAPVRLISAATFFETSLYAIGLQVIALTSERVELARYGFQRFAKGQHPAGLNLGDCFSYALSKAAGEPLPAKGADFPQTGLLLVPL